MDCSFKTADGRFNLRVGAIILHDEKILMVKSHSNPSYYTVGGRVQLHEPTDQAVLREATEETGISFGIDWLGFIHENFFILAETGEVYHEFCVYYYLFPKGDLRCIRKYVVEGLVEEELVWLPVQMLDDYLLYPDFFKKELRTPVTSVKHIISRRY